MHELATLAARIRDNLDDVAGTYAGLLCEIADYAAMPAADRLQAAGNALQLVAAGLETRDASLFIEFVRAIAVERMNQGFEPASVQRSLLLLSRALEPLLETVESVLFLSRSLGEAMMAVSEAAWHKARSAEQEQQRLLRQVIDLNPSLVFVKDRESRFVLGNRALATMYGTTVDDLIGKHEADLGGAPEQAQQFHLDDLEVMDSLQERILPDRPLTDAAGNLHWMQAIKRPLIDADGVARHVLGVSIDVTRHKLLQQQVQESLERRGRQVQTATEVAQELAVVPVLEDLYGRVVTLIKERFGYYHAQIFRYEPAQGAIVLVSGYGEPGRLMLAGGHRLAMGRGVVGAAAATGQAVLASDVTLDPDWVPNPHLPHTRGELAVPIKLRDQVLGILDVQSDTPGLLTAEDQLMLEGLCGQIAAAIESTRLRQETGESLRELERLYRVVSHEGWQAARQEMGSRGYLFDGHAVVSAENLWLPEVGQALQRQSLVVPEDGRAAIAPLGVRGAFFGALGVELDPDRPLSADELALVEAVTEQVAQALENARLFEEEEQARGLLALRINELDCLNDIGRKIDELPPVPEFLEWVAGRVRQAMRYPDLCLAAIELEGHTYGQTHALAQPCHIVQNLHQAGRRIGRVGIAYSQEREFLDEESALLGDIARRVNGYIESRRLFDETQQTARTLLAERTMLRTLIDALPDVVYVKDAESRFVINNRAQLRTMGGPSQEQVLGKTDFDMFPYELAAGFYADEQNVLSTGQPLLDREEYVLDEQGNKRWLWTTKIPLFDDQGRATGLVGIGRDITERKHSQATLERRRAQLQCLSDIGQRIGQGVAVPEFLEWVAGRIPAAMQYPARAMAAIEFQGRILGQAEALKQPRQMVQTLTPGGVAVGRICIAYRDEPVPGAHLSRDSSPRRPGEGIVSEGEPGEIDFLDEESALLGDISRRVAGYVENRQLFDDSQRLFEEARARAEELNILNEMSRALTRVLDETAVLDSVYQNVPRLMPASNFYIALYDAPTDEVTFALDYREGELRPPARRQAGAGLTEYIIHTREPLLIERDIASRLLSLSGVEMIGGEAQSWLGAPLLVGDQVLGVMAVQSYTTPGLYTEHHRDLLMAVASHAAVALQSARLLEEAQARAERELLVRTITDRVRRGMDRDSIVRITLQELGQMLGASKSVLRLGTRDQLPVEDAALEAASRNGRGDGNGRRDVD